MVQFHAPERLWGVWVVLTMWLVLSVATLTTFMKPAASEPAEVETVDAGPAFDDVVASPRAVRTES